MNETLASRLVFPEPLVEKALRLEARGETVHRAMITVPAVVRTGQPFAVTISLLDRNAMPIVSSGEALLLSGDGIDEQEITFPEGRMAVCRAEGVQQPESGIFRLTGQVDGKLFVSNPSRATEDSRPLVLWGDPHIHTTVGDCHAERCRTRTVAYAAARYVYGLDFVAIADHVSWAPRGTAGKWYDNLALCELYDEPGECSALYCYETSMRGGRGGDCNMYLRQPTRFYVDPWPDDLNAAQLCEKVAGERFTVPHHTTRIGKHGEIPAEAYPGEALMPVVEIHSKWGTSEYRGNPTPLLEIHPGPSYVQDLLAQGYRLGFIGGTDSHTSLTFCRWLESEAHQAQPGITAVSVDSHDRDAIYDAIKQRRCYAACGERILLELTCGGLEMGESGQLPHDGVAIHASFAAESEIKCVEVIRNNKVVHRVEPEDWKGSLAWVDEHVADATPIKAFTSGKATVFYYVRVTAQDDARAWSSPCWFQCDPLP